MKYLLLVPVFLALACSTSNQKPSVEELFEADRNFS